MTQTVSAWKGHKQTSTNNSITPAEKQPFHVLPKCGRAVLQICHLTLNWHNRFHQIDFKEFQLVTFYIEHTGMAGKNYAYLLSTSLNCDANYVLCGTPEHTMESNIKNQGTAYTLSFTPVVELDTYVQCTVPVQQVIEYAFAVD